MVVVVMVVIGCLMIRRAAALRRGEQAQVCGCVGCVGGEQAEEQEEQGDEQHGFFSRCSGQAG